MLDIKLVRENSKVIEKDLMKRGDTEKLDILNELIEKDKKKRDLMTQIQHMRHKRNELTKEIAELKRDKKPEREIKRKIKEMKELPNQIKKMDAELEELEKKCKHILMGLPNILHESVPFGKDDSANKLVRKIGKKPILKNPKGHLDILSDLGLINAERANKVAGHGFFYMNDDLVQLDYALMAFASDFLIKKGFTLVQPPFMMRRKPYEGVTDLNDFENVMYKIENEDLYLIATSEHSIASMFMDEVIERKDLPLKFAGISPCFRKEVGTHGKYTKGLFRMHQFNKIEQFVFSHPNESWNIHEELQKNVEELYTKLGLHARVVNVCTGDIGNLAAKKYDIEIWMADNVFREAGSNSNCTDYQARRLNIKYREKEGVSPSGYIHTLNNTAIATSRIMLAIVEQYQQKDGSIAVPKVLQKYMNKKVIIKNKNKQ
ncbi:serine--tRNA ligase [Candidatus Aenigmatarchaeota archaeon]